MTKNNSSSAKEIAHHISAAFRRPTNLILFFARKFDQSLWWPKWFLWFFSGPQPKPTASFGDSNSTGLSVPSYPVIFQTQGGKKRLKLRGEKKGLKKPTFPQLGGTHKSTKNN